MEGTNYLQPILSAIPLEWCSEVFAGYVNTLMTAEALFVTGEHNLVLSGRFNAYAVVCKGFRGIDCNVRRVP